MINPSLHTMPNLARYSAVSRHLIGTLLCCALLAAPIVQAQQLTPAQVAFLKTETRKADEAYVKSVAQIVGARTSTVAKVMPENSRITDPVARLIAALEQALGKPLTDDQKAAIQAADMQRQKHVEWADLNAHKR